AIIVAGGPGRGSAHEDGGPSLEVARENVSRPVVVAGHQVAGVTLECYVTAVCTDLRVVGRAIAGGPGRGGADQGGYACLEVAHEHVKTTVRIIGHQVTGQTLEGDIAAVGTERRPLGEPVATCPRGCGTHQAGDAGLQIAHEQVPIIIGVAGNQV